MAGSFRAPSIISDPSGRLTRLQAAVSREYARRRWVEERCRGTQDGILQHLDALTESKPFHDQVSIWLFATGLMTHVLLVAGLKNPTVRRRYMAARELLAEHDRLEFYEVLLEMLGCAQMSRERVEHHLAALAELFDAAKAVIKTPYRFAADLSDIARPIAIDGSRELIERGYHREAVFWIVATFARCHDVLSRDAPLEMQERFRPAFRQLLADLGITSFAEFHRRGEQVRAFLPRLWEEAEAIMAANPEIKD
jgi:hypothetical protein